MIEGNGRVSEYVFLWYMLVSFCMYVYVYVCARERCKFVITSFFEKNYFGYTNKQADFDGKKMSTAVIVT